MIFRFDMFPRSALAALRALWWKLRGWQLIVDNHEQQDRLFKCALCDYQDHNDGQCEKCGCFLQAKTMLASERCPIGLWGYQRRKLRLTRKANQ